MSYLAIVFIGSIRTKDH